MSTATLGVGAKVSYDGEVWSVVELSGARAMLARAGGRTLSVAITRLLSPPNGLLGADNASPTTSGRCFPR